jgi:AmmeMemoRadiSam system protein B
MPYGVEKVDVSVGEMLYRNNPFLFSSDPGHHEGEHSIEVQLPFLHYVMNPGYRIVPVLLGNVTVHDCRNVADALRPWFDEESLFVISSDFSHYPSYEKAAEIDRSTMEAIVSGNPDSLVRILEKNESLGVQDLHTSLCGWSSVLTLMYLTSASHAHTYEPLEYRNSGDNTLYGDRDNVVGYWSIYIS